MNSTPVSAFAAYSAANVYAQVPQKAKSSKKKTKPTKIVGRQASSAAKKVLSPNKNANKKRANDEDVHIEKKAKKLKQHQPVLQNGAQLKKKAVPSKKQSPGNASFNAELDISDTNSITIGQTMFEQLIQPCTLREFMDGYWEKQVLCIKRDQSDFYSQLNVSSEAIDEMLRTNTVEFTKNIDVTSYENGERQTHNPDGRALPEAVWSSYAKGCSIRLLNPQTFMPSLWKLNATLQEYFHCLVGANLYLTPANSQGFAPHYDDIEAFVLQIEGKKLWRIYKPRSENETLPRESSGNFSEDEIGECVFEKVLEAGDLLYFPRGWIHQAKTIDNQHSLHITLSVYQKTAHADLFDEIVKNALQSAITTDVKYRRGLPLDIWQHLGAAHADKTSKRRTSITNYMRQMFENLLKHVDFDAAVDSIATKFQYDALPPKLSSAENALTVFGTKTTFESGQSFLPEFEQNSRLRLVRANILRLARDNDIYRVYYHIDNSREYHGSEMNFVEVDEIAADVVKQLIQTYPHYIEVSQFLDDEHDEKMGIVQNLWDRGLLVTDKPLE